MVNFSRLVVSAFSLISLAIVTTACDQGSNKPSDRTISPDPRPNPKKDLKSGRCEIGDTPMLGIINGTPLKDDFDVAHRVVRLYIKREGSDGLTVCTGSILDEQTVLTAAHCMEGSAGAVVQYNSDPECEQGGFWDSNKPEGVPPQSVRKVVSVAVHSKFVRQTLANDLAMLRTEAPMPGNYRPVKLMGWHEIPATSQQKILAVGYGKISYYQNDSDPNNRLRFGIMRPLSDEGKLKAVRGEPDTMLGERIFFDQSDENGICAGDSGGPAFVQVNNEWVQVGVASFVASVSRQKESCRDISAHIDVGTYAEWINSAKTELPKHKGIFEF